MWTQTALWSRLTSPRVVRRQFYSRSVKGRTSFPSILSLRLCLSLDLMEVARRLQYLRLSLLSFRPCLNLPKQELIHLPYQSPHLMLT